ncbi:MAG: hypothetical protein Q9188_002487 [Gyalolechia gomerana]
MIAPAHAFDPRCIDLKASGRGVQDQVPAPARYFQQYPPSQTQNQAHVSYGSPSDVHQNQKLLESDFNLKIRRLAESFVVTDKSHIQDLETIFGNEEAINILQDGLFVWVRHQPAQTPSSTPKALQYSESDLNEFQGMPREPAGILLYGPNGTGKTSLCTSAVKDSGRTLLNLTTNDFCSRLVGDSEKILAETFILAKKLAPSAMFIDEIDKVVGGGMNLDNFMTRVDGLMLINWSKCTAEGQDVVVLAATNAFEDVPKDFLSRFTVNIEVDVLSFSDTETMLQSKLTFRHRLTATQLRQFVAVLAPLGARAIKNFVTAVKDHLQRDLAKATNFEKVYGTQFTKSAATYRMSQESVTISDGRKTRVWVPCDVNDRGCQTTTYRSPGEEGDAAAMGIASLEDCSLALKVVTGDDGKSLVA